MNHIIKKQVLALEIPPGSDSWKVSDQFKELFNTRVLPRLEQVCNEMGLHRGLSLKIDQLNLDIGTIAYKDAAQVWAGRIEDSFREELQKFKSERLNSKELASLKPTEQTDLDTFMYFMETGTLPWYVPEKDNLSPKVLLDKLLSDQPQALIKKLTQSKHIRVVCQRLINQFDESQITKLLSFSESSLLQSSLDWLIAEVALLSTDAQSSFEQPLLLAKTIIRLDKSLQSKNSKALFQFILDQIIEEDSNHLSKPLNELYKNLKNRYINTKIKKILHTKDEPVWMISALQKHLTSEIKNTQSKASNRAEKNTSNQDLSKAFDPNEIDQNAHIRIDTDNSLDGSEETIEHDLKALKPSGDQEDKTSLEMSQDERVRAHLERIKKQQGDLKASDQNYPDPTTKEQSSSPEEEATAVAPNQTADHGIQTPFPNNTGENSTDDLTRAVGKNNKGMPNAGSKDIYHRKTSDAKNEKNQPSELVHLKKDKPNRTVEDEYRSKDSKGLSNSTKGKDSDSNKSETGFDRHLSNTLDSKLSGPQVDNKKKSGAGFEKSLGDLQDEENHADLIKECYIQNAGLILFWPYLGHFFKDLGLTENGKFISLKHQEDAALTLQYLLNESAQLDEHLLPLNKLLCGLTVNHPIGRQLALNKPDQEKNQMLLETVIKNWPALKNTSIPGFQQSFLNRYGVLKRRENNWLLQIEKMPFDMLIEQLPWPIGIIRLSWMDKPLYVEW